MGIFGNLFSKQACEICKKEVGALSRTKLKDKTYICNDCRKNTSILFEPHLNDLEETKKHLAHMEEMDQLYKEKVEPLSDKEIDFCGHHGSYKIGFVDSIKMFFIITPQTKKKNKKELFAYDEIESFGPYENLNDGSHEGQKRIEECGVAIKMRAYRMPIKIPIAKNVDTPLGGERILEHLNAATGGKHSSMIGAAGAVASTILNNI
ncbi:DUF4428 domain-containing protein [Candidatus Saccharibacteria bacterium]|nr:DUF4428 domain-containing protein [Candidatus Saccharibacteria bacterium]